MFIYYFIWFFISIFSFLNIRTAQIKVVYIVFLILLTIMTGFRYKVGGDWGNYIAIYDLFKGVSFSESLKLTDPGYALFNYIGQYFEFEDTILVNLFCSLIFYFCFYLLAKNTENYWLSLLISFPYLILVVSMGYTRQSVAIALILVALKYALESRLKLFFIFLFFAILFHKTAIIALMFLPFFISYKIFYNQFFFLLYSLFSFLFVSLVVYISSLTGDNIYTDQSSEMTSAGALFRISVHFLTLIFYLFYRKKIIIKYPNYYRLFDYMGLLVLYVFILAIPFSTLADRFNLYLITFDMFVFSVLYSMLKGFNKYFMLGSIIFFNTIMLIIWLSFGSWSHAWLPYQNYISNYIFGAI